MEDTNKKAVTLESLAAASDLIATKAEVRKQIEEVQLGGGSVEFATTEEVLALFQDATTTE